MKIQIVSVVFVFISVVGFADNVYVSKNGSDSNSGSADSPFLTIQKAANVMQGGDICIISEGFYPETIIPKNDGVTFMSEEGERVEISGFNVVDSWQKHKGNIYVTTLSNQLNDNNQLIYNKRMMNLARWPNKTNYNPFDIEALKITGTNSSISHSDIPDYSWEDGGVLWFLGKSRWTSWRTSITVSSSGRVNFETLSDNWQYAGSHSPTGGGEFFLQNVMEALDSNGEWYVDRESKKLYFQAPDGENPSDGEALVRARTTVFNLKNRSNITIDGLIVTGGNVVLESAKNCTVRNCEIIYGNHSIVSTSAAFTGEGSVVLSDNSNGNIVEKNNIQWGAGNGVILKGANNVIRDNYIGNFNYVGSYACPVELRGKNDLINNEIFNAGRDCVRGGGNGSDCGYNNIHHSNLINDDCGAIYTCCGTFGFTRIHHNWIHDIQSRDENYERYKGTGVYLDNSTRKVIVDHNVMWNLEWTCIQINWEGTDLLIYNNTLWSNRGEHSASMGRWVNGYDLKNVQVYNSLANNNEYHYTDIQRPCLVSMNGTPPFENYNKQNFVPKENTKPIDYGIEITDYTEGFTGAAPDAGAYERGVEAWIPGPTWELNSQVLTTGILSKVKLGHNGADFKMYPNPAHGSLFIDVDDNGGNVGVEVFDFAGKRLLADDLINGNNELNIQSLDRGTYLVTVKVADLVITKPLVVQN